MPANKNGKINPIVYTPIKRKPFAPDSALPAIRRTLVNAGPTHGVHAKLNANPINKSCDWRHRHFFKPNRKSMF